LVYSIREFYDNQFKLENSQSLVQRFAECISPASRCGRSPNLLVSEFLPFILHILSSGGGSGALIRATASIELLKPHELQSFVRHAALLRWLGLSYVSSNGASDRQYHAAQRLVSAELDPPIHQLVAYSSFELPVDSKRRDIPSEVSAMERP
jgi:chromosome transmission fidelity protein 18